MASEITVYNSQGYEYDEDGKSNRQDEYISELIFANVRFIADTRGDTEFITFFRGRESMAGRSEMFYARYVTTASTPDLERFSRELESYVEDDLGLVMDATAEGVIYDRIGEDMRDLVTIDADDSLIGELLRGGDQLQFGVSDHDVAIGVLQRYISAADTIAICQNANANVLSDIDIVAEVGSYAGTEPLGNTGQLIQEAKKRREAAREPQQSGSTRGHHPSGSGHPFRTQESSGMNTATRVGLVILALVGVSVILFVLVLPILGYCFPILPQVDITGGCLDMSFSGQDTGNLITVEITGAEPNTPLVLRVDGAQRANVRTDKNGSATTNIQIPPGEHRVALADSSGEQPSSTATESGGSEVLLTHNLTVSSPRLNINVEEQKLVTDESVSLTATSSPLLVEPSVDGAIIYVDQNHTNGGEITLSEGEHNITATRTDNGNKQVVSGTVVVDYDESATIEPNANRDNVVWVNGSTNASSVSVEAGPAEGDSITYTRFKPTNVSVFNESIALPVQSGTWEVTAAANGTTLATENVEVSTSITSFEVNGESYEPGKKVSGDITLNGTVDVNLTSVAAEPGGSVTVENGNFTGLTVGSGASTAVVTGTNDGQTVFVVELTLNRTSDGQGSLQIARQATKHRGDSRPGPSSGPITRRAPAAAAR